MAVTTYTISGKVTDIVAGPYLPRTVRVFVRTNLDETQGSALVAGGVLRVGGVAITPDTAGVFSQAGFVGSTSTDTNQAGTLLYEVTVEYQPRNSKDTTRWRSAWFALNANTDIATIQGTTFTPGAAFYASGREAPNGIAGLDSNAKLYEARLPSRVVDLLADTRNLRGTGSPEGVAKANVGTRYTDTNATLGAIDWIKAAGTDLTGWRVAWGNTGVRALVAWTNGTITSGAFADGSPFGPRAGTTGGVYAQRINDVVHFWVSNLAVATPVTPGDYDIASAAGLGLFNGQVPVTQNTGMIQNLSTLSSVIRTYVPTNAAAGAVMVGGTRFMASILATGLWATSLPGAPS